MAVHPFDHRPEAQEIITDRLMFQGIIEAVHIGHHHAIAGIFAVRLIDQPTAKTVLRNHRLIALRYPAIELARGKGSGQHVACQTDPLDILHGHAMLIEKPEQIIMIVGGSQITDALAAQVRNGAGDQSLAYDKAEITASRV